ncbi:hypothetical protein [Shewanella colwelliana]|uniref:hypothetical protein n=1 Tax=Shewanella colwelliana TaxID=23 RepID=UPI0022B00026|nr:hypothetical protein [Shewanella colwelliana]MCZ4339736.1 hypothetical protein [Shewanella colwelliana]
MNNQNPANTGFAIGVGAITAPGNTVLATGVGTIKYLRYPASGIGVSAITVAGSGAGHRGMSDHGN